MPNNDTTPPEPVNSPQPTVADRVLFPQVDIGRIVSLVLWPVAILMVFQRSVILGVNGDRTDDFAPVYRAALAFLRSEPVYTENYNTVDPHYLYPPSGSMLMAPWAISTPSAPAGCSSSSRSSSWSCAPT